MQKTTQLLGAVRKPLTSKHGNKNFYKGNRSGLMGRFTTRGNFIPEKHRQRNFVIPNLEGFKLSPFVSPKVERTYYKNDLKDYFQGESELIKKCRAVASQVTTEIK